MNYIISEVTKEVDKLEISIIYEESWKYAYKGIIPQSYLDSIPKGQWVKNLNNADRHSLIVKVDDRYIGTTSFCKSRFPEFENYGEIVSIYLLPEYMGKGYGRELLAAAMSELQKMNYKDIFLWVLEENTRARVFYERNGFNCSNVYLNDNIGGKELREVAYCYYNHV